MAVAIAAAAIPTEAEAGSYVTRECFDSNFSAPDAVYATDGALAFTPANSCGGLSNGVAIGTQGNGFTGPLQATWTFRAPNGAQFNSVSLQRRAMAGGSYGHLVAVCNPQGSCNGVSSNAPSPVGTQFGPGGWTYLNVFLGCGLAICDAGGYVYVRDIEFSVDDFTQPVVKAVSGSILRPGMRRGTETMTVSAEDAGGGVRWVFVSVNGAQVVSRRVDCALDENGVAAKLRPCGTASETFSLDTEDTPWREGQNLVEICVEDYATGGSPNRGCAQRSVNVDNSCPDSAGSPLASSISAGLQKTPTSAEQDAIAVRSSQGATVRGTVSGASGPVPGASVCLYEQIDVQGGIRQLAQVTRSRSDGRFAIQVEPGPSRTFDVVYRSDSETVERDGLSIASSVKPTLSVGPSGIANGERAFFKGQLPGPNAEDRVVALQARAGKKWRTFKQLRTNAKGKFRGLYRFTSTVGKVIFRFRVSLKRQGGYPYEPGTSAVRRVMVRG